MDAGRLGRGEMIAGVSRRASCSSSCSCRWFGFDLGRDSTAAPTGVGRRGRPRASTRDVQRLAVVRLHRPRPAGHRDRRGRRRRSRRRMARDVALPVAVERAHRRARDPRASCSSLYRHHRHAVRGPIDLDRKFGVFLGLIAHGRDRLRRLARDAGGGHLLRRPGRPDPGRHRDGGGGHRRRRHRRRPRRRRARRRRVVSGASSSEER